MSDTEIMAAPVDGPVAAMLAALRREMPCATVTEIVRRVEVDGMVVEPRLVLPFPIQNEDAA